MMSAMPRTYRSTEEHRESFDDGALRRCVRDHSSLSHGHRHVDTSRCALDLDASSFAFLSFLSFTTPLVTTSTSTSGRHGRRRRRGRPRIETREGADRVFAANGRSVRSFIHSVGEGAKRKTNRGKRETMVGCLERSATSFDRRRRLAMETSRHLVRGRARHP